MIFGTFGICRVLKLSRLCLHDDVAREGRGIQMMCCSDQVQFEKTRNTAGNAIRASVKLPTVLNVPSFRPTTLRVVNCKPCLLNNGFKTYFITKCSHSRHETDTVCHLQTTEHSDIEPDRGGT